MKLLKSFTRVGLFVATLALSITAYGQHCDGGNRWADMTPEDMAKKTTAKMDKFLDLNDGQEEKVYPINLTYAKQIKDLISSEDVDWKEVKTLKKANHEDIKPILTEEQLAKFDKMGKGHKGRRGGKGHRGGCGDKGSRLAPEDRKAMMNEIKTYIDDNAMPVLRTQRTKLERSIKPDDKTTINELRAIIEELRPQIRSFFQTIKEDGEFTEEQKAALQQLMIDKKENMFAAAALAKNYTDDIKPLKEDIKSDIKTWKEDIKAIFKKYMEEAKEDKEDDEDKGGHGHGHWGNGDKGDKGEDGDKGGHGHWGNGDKDGDKACSGEGRRGGFNPLKKVISNVGFLLLDPQGEGSLLEEEIAEEIISSLEAKSVRVYPNPAIGSNNLTYEVTKEGNVKIELLNERGELVKMVSNDFKTAGQHTDRIVLDDLQGFNYFYRITDATGNVETIRFVVSDTK